jgi:hypothetical protein
MIDRLRYCGPVCTFDRGPEIFSLSLSLSLSLLLRGLRQCCNCNYNERGYRAVRIISHAPQPLSRNKPVR